MPQAALTVTGDAKYYDIRGESGNLVNRGFCRNCGSPLFVRPAVMPDLIGLWAASLDDPSWFTPRIELFTASAQPWDALDPTLSQFEGDATMEQVEQALGGRAR